MKFCHVCSGSGEGAYDGSVCPACRGLGVEKRRDWVDDDIDDWRVDARIEERLEEEE